MKFVTCVQMLSEQNISTMCFVPDTSSFIFLPYLDVKNNDVVPWVLNSILSKYITSQNPHVRQAACIWLLSLVKKVSQHKEITVGLLYSVVLLNVKINIVTVQSRNTDNTSLFSLSRLVLASDCKYEYLTVICNIYPVTVCYLA